jgi:hypothetical protein
MHPDDAIRTYLCTGYRPVRAESATAAASALAERQARRDYGRRGFMHHIRLDSWTRDGRSHTFQAFIGRPVPGEHYTCAGRNIWLTVEAEGWAMARKPYVVIKDRGSVQATVNAGFEPTWVSWLYRYPHATHYAIDDQEVLKAFPSYRAACAWMFLHHPSGEFWSMQVKALANSGGGYTAVIEFHDGRLLVQWPHFRTEAEAEAFAAQWIRDAVAAHTRREVAAGHHLTLLEVWAMSDEPDSLVLVLLRRIDERLGRLERQADRHATAVAGRMTGLEGRMTALEARMTATEDWSADVTHRLDRIERRLDIVEV